jgi:indole-3-glycerol phosphate synthase
VNRLEEILADKRAEIARAKVRATDFRGLAEKRSDFRDFASAIQRRGKNLKIIAETKKASPSAGVLEPNYNPAQTAKKYERHGASAISVLTERRHFSGSPADLQAVRQAVALPILRKDFIIEEVQIFESVGIGADAILLIVAALGSKELKALHACAVAQRLNVLVEVHTRDEIAVALETGAKLIGINNRDLATFQVDVATTEKLLPEIPPGITIVSESGIRTAAEVERMADWPIDALLVGEALMRADEMLLREMLSPERSAHGGKEFSS